MNACLSDFRVVNPTLRTFSAAEARIAQSSIRFKATPHNDMKNPHHLPI